MNYSDFQNQTASEKIVLCRLGASKRLMGWELQSGSIYKLTSFTQKVIETLSEDGDDLTENTTSFASLVSSEYYLDRTNDILYVRTSDDSHPNSKFMSVIVQFFFSNVPATFPHDLDSGFEVFWEPVLKPGSDFGNNIDTINQVGESIDGSGNLQLINDNTFWLENFDRWTFDNKKCYIYSYNKNLPLSEAQILFKGFVVDKKYTATGISFPLKDEFTELREAIPLANISDLALRTDEDQANYKQRLVFGRVFGHRMVNVDKVLDGYPISGTASTVYDSMTSTYDIEFTDTEFLTEVSPEDTLIINGIEVEVEEVLSDTSLVFDDDVSFNSLFTNVDIYIIPSIEKRYMNRKHHVVGHVVREPLTTCLPNSSVDTLKVNSTRDIYPGDDIYIDTLGSGELAKVLSIVGNNTIKLVQSLGTVPIEGTDVLRPAIQNVKMDNIPLTYYRDYTFDATTGILELRPDAEINAAPVKKFFNEVTFTLGSRTVTGVGLSQLTPGMMIGLTGQLTRFEINSIIDDTELELVENSIYSGTGEGLFQDFIFEDGETVLSCDLLGMTSDGTKSGTLLKYAPQICKQLLLDSILPTALINTDSFDDANDIAYHDLGIVVPQEYDDTEVPTFIEVMNLANRSVFGSIIIKHIGQDTGVYYNVLQPSKNTSTVTKFSESDVLNFNFNATSKNSVKNVYIQYLNMEYNPNIAEQSFLTHKTENEHAAYVIQTNKEKTIKTYLVLEADAKMMGSRWGLILSQSMGRLSFNTKLQGAKINVGDVIEVEHRKLFYRLDSNDPRRIFLVESVKKDGLSVSIECVDFSDTFNRIATISDTTNDYSSSTDTELLYSGYITDQYGMQDNNPQTFGKNLIW